MKTLAKISLALAMLLCPLAGLAQNDPDTDITYHLVDPRDRYANKLTQMDMDIDEQGNLVVAYVIESFYPASLGIAVRDTSGGWRVQEVLSLGQRGDYGTVKHLTMSVASGINGETKVAVALVFDPESNQRLQPWQRKDEVWIYEGPIGRAWTPVEKTGTRMASEPQFAVSDATFAHPWISYLSSSRGSFADYVLGVAWTSRGGDLENPPGVKIRFYRQDELDHVRLEQLKQKNLPPYYKPEIFQVAGRGGVLTGSTFGRPSLTMDLNQGVLGIAVEDVTNTESMVLSGVRPRAAGTLCR